MKPATYNLEIEQGAKFARVLRVLSGLSSIDGYTARMQIRQRPGGKIFWDSNDLNAGDVFTVDEEEKTISFTLAAATTAAFKFDTAVYDVDVNQDRWVKGKVVLNKEVTDG